MKRICLVDYDMSVRGGVEQVTASIANALADYYEVHVLSLCSKGHLIYELDSRVKYKVLLNEEPRLRQMQKMLKPLLKAYFRDNQIQVAIIQGNYPGFLTAQMRFFTKTKLIFCDHGALMNQWNRKDIVVIRLFSALLCHKVIVLTQQSRDDYIRKFHLRAKKVDYIYNWIDLDRPRSMCYDAQSKRIISAGRFGKEKGFEMLVKAFAPVAQKHPEWSLDLYGDGEMMPEVTALVEELGMRDQVNLMGMCSDLPERYGKYSMYVLPSWREGLPLVLLEAKANRLPIVSFDIMTGPREIVRDGIDGILVPPYDLEQMSHAMCSLIEDESVRRKMSDRSQENLDLFSKEHILKQWQMLIEQIQPGA